MIAQLTGTLIDASFTEAIIDVNGVGYQVLIPMSTFDRLPRVDEKKSVTLLTWLQVREDALTLFGFATRQERDVFLLLITVNGIGAKTALNILSCMNVVSFCQAVASGDLKSLKKISGVGPKSAERILVELRDKIQKIAPETAFGGGAAPTKVDKAVEDAILALGQLGFQGPKFQKLVADVALEIPEDQRSTENIIRKALQALNR
ncbi:MAG: Holliday junction branch migration protein RuvA [Lentisphaerae bacterium]|nr:Holliday junction branch migration protein RuvA [Lentisphaerota bacterium]